MKIGILTFHCAHNYGAVLQCYALQEVLKNMGHDVEVIDYQPEYLVKPYDVFNFRRLSSPTILGQLKKCLQEIIVLPKRLKRHKAFSRFINHKLNLSERIVEDKIPTTYDAYVMGSDQIWNPKITKGFDAVYFGDFTYAKENRIYIAYAVSMAVTELDETSKCYLSNALSNFNAVSVRERQLVPLLQPLTKNKIEVVLDPTLLADSEFWGNVAKSPHIRGKYVLVYQIRRDANTLRIANEIALQLNAFVVEITNPNMHINSYKFMSSSPEEFVGLFKNASCVVTTSFHGTAFSVIFHRPLYFVKLGGELDTRSEHLLMTIGLEDRMIAKNSSISFNEIDYSGVNMKLLQLKQASIEYLTRSIQRYNLEHASNEQ